MDKNAMHRQETVRNFKIGDTSIPVRIVRSGKDGNVYLSLHQDEKTSRQTGEALIKTDGGTYIELDAGTSRYITVKVNGTSYSLDPNRMFSLDSLMRGEGINPKPNERDATVIFTAAQDFLEKIVKPELAAADSALLVALHNNRDNPQGRTEDLGTIYYAAHPEEASKVSTVPGQDSDDFFLTPSPALYERLRADKTFNVVQERTGLYGTVKGDGSLSQYWQGQRSLIDDSGLPRPVLYVNAEAQHGHYDVQLAMLKKLDAIGDALSQSADTAQVYSLGSLGVLPLAAMIIVAVISAKPLQQMAEGMFALRAKP